MSARLLLALGLVTASSAADRLVEGNPASPVRVLVYEDLQCPDCAAFRKMLDEHILPKYKTKAAFEHRDFALPKHSWARRAAIAARFFESVKPELGVEFRRATLANISAIAAPEFDSWVRSFAAKHGVDPGRAVASLSDEKFASLADYDYREGVARGVAKTPTVFVDGEPFVETFTLEELVKALDAATAGVKN
jgi:protein-disulfide isomerase